MTAPHVLLVHGASHRSSSWHLLERALAARGIRCATVDLPSASPELGDLHADVEAIRSALDAVPAHEPVTVICHSYGGMPSTEAVAGSSSVSRIVYLAAYMPDAGETLLDLVDEGDDSDWAISDDGLTISAVDPARLFYNRCPPAVAAEAIRNLAPQSLASFEQSVQDAAWRDIPSSYVVCTDDRAIPPHVQRRMAARATTTTSIDSDHSPFLSMPDRLADLLVELLGA